MPAQTPPNYADLAKKHGGTTAEVRKVDYSTAARKYGGVLVNDQSLPPVLQRIQEAVGAKYEYSPPISDGAIATVGVHEPHIINIRDRQKFDQSPAQVKAHELIHLLKSNLPGPIQNAIPKDNPNNRYDISQQAKWRDEGKRLWQLPQEAAATIVQRYVADPASRPSLQPWMNDLTQVPLSVENPTSPDQKGINVSIRPPLPPAEAYK